MSISIVFADDHPLVRTGAQALLGREANFSIVGVAADGLTTIRLTERLKPNVLVVDLMMPGLSGLEVLRIVRERSPRTRIVILSMYANAALIVEAPQNGVIGYVLKGCPQDNLVHAVREAAAGRRFLSPPVAEIALNASLQRSEVGSFGLHGTLTPRQREVLQLAAEGKTNTQIGKLLDISPRTVETHRAVLSQKLRLQNHTDLIRHAMRHGLISLDTEKLLLFSATAS